MPRTKWFSGLNRTTSLHQAATVVLRARVDTVKYYLDRVASESANAEDVHQLRVGTRRLVAALTTFKPWLNDRVRRKMRKAARQIRRDAGAVRDLDVLMEIFTKQRRAHRLTRNRAATLVAQTLSRRRADAFHEMRSNLAHTQKRFLKAEQKLQESLEATAPETLLRDRLETAAARILRPRVRKLFGADRARLADFDQLHSLRIAAKRLRYAMEIFAMCFPPDFRRVLYRHVEGLQSELGEINDLRNLLTELRSARPVKPPSNHVPPLRQPINRLKSALRKQLDERRRNFLDRWNTAERRQILQRFEQVLAKPEVAR